MKNSENGFSALGLLLVFIVIGLISIVGWFVWERSRSKDTSISAPIVSEANINKEEVADEGVIPDGFVKYTNDSLGMTFAYPKNWGSVDAETTGINPQTRYFKFSNEPRMTLAGNTKNYQTEPRGGGYIDIGGFVKEGNGFKLRDWAGNVWADFAKEYELNKAGNCIVVNDKLNEVQGPTYHATCNLMVSEMYGVNLYYTVPEGDAKLGFAEFKQVIDTVKIN